MAYMKTDRFGRRVASIALKDKKGTGYGAGFIEVGNKLFRLEVCGSNKDGVTGWVTMTEMNRKQGPVMANGSFGKQQKGGF